MSFHFSGDVNSTNGAYGGDINQTASSNFTQNFSWQTRMPRFLSPTRRNIITNLTLTESKSSSCIQRTSDTACVSYYDLRRFDVEAGFRAIMQRGITAGLNFGYVYNNVSSLGLLTSTITINATFTVPLSSLGM
jgi:hypothetical protein